MDSIFLAVWRILIHFLVEWSFWITWGFFGLRDEIRDSKWEIIADS
jgi:hypothetical protein